ncbi:Ankyrin repeat family protein [Euphorbia peplus]|nr:Ankyrin repeat family protein [Euphorbia peplus]
MDPLQNASIEGNIDGLYTEIRDNPRILSIIDETPFMDTPLHIAASSGHVQFALEIMRLKPSFATKCNPDGFTPIHIAIQKKYTQMVVCFADMDPGLVRVKGREGTTPLHLVVKEGNMVLLQRFIEACPECTEDVNVRYETALHIALNSSMFEAFQLILDKLQRKKDEEANSWKKRVVNSKDLEGNTALHISTFRNQVQFTESLVTYNKSNPGMLEVNAVNEKSQTAMDIAQFFNHQHIEQLLGQITVNENRNLEIEDVLATNVSEEEIHYSEKYLKFDSRKTSPEKTRTDLLVMAALMAVATYLAVLSPPGGADNKTGIALLSKHEFRYVWFMLGNTAMFFISMYMIKVIMHGYPYFWDFYVGILAMESPYSATIVSITPSGNIRVFFLVFCIVMPIVIPIVVSLLREIIKRREQRRLARNRRAIA